MASLLPVYYQIKNTIQDWIVAKDFAPGERIPSENELAKMFNVSRLTVRQGISLLIQEKLLYSRRGEGTFVTHDTKLIDSFGLEFSGFMDDLLYQVSRSKTKTVHIEKIKATRIIKEKLEIEVEDVIKIIRVRTLNNQIFAYTVNFLPQDIGEKITKKDLFVKPLLQILEVDLGIEFDEASQTIEASFANQEVAEKLQIQNGSPILYVERVMFDSRKKPVEYVQSSYRGDIYKYVVRFKVDKSDRDKKWVQYSNLTKS